MRRRQIAGLTSLNPYDNPVDREAFAEIQKERNLIKNEEIEKNPESNIKTEETREIETKL